MATLSEEALLKQLAETKKRQRELSQAIRQKKQLQKVAKGLGAESGDQSVASLLQDLGAASCDSSQPSLPPQLANIITPFVVAAEAFWFLH